MLIPTWVLLLLFIGFVLLIRRIEKERNILHDQINDLRTLMRRMANEIEEKNITNKTKKPIKLGFIGEKILEAFEKKTKKPPKKVVPDKTDKNL